MTDSEQQRPEIVVGLVATPLDYPARSLRGSPPNWPISARRAGGRGRAVDLSAMVGVRWRRVAMVSLPALGLRQLPAIRAVVPDLVGRLLTDASDQRVPPAGWEPAELAGPVAAIHRMVGEADAGEWGYVASRLAGRVRLVTGMVRANRPGRALLGLSKLLVGSTGPARLDPLPDQVGVRVAQLAEDVVRGQPRRAGLLAPPSTSARRPAISRR